MKLHLPNSAFIGNIDSFLRGFVPSDPGSLTITSNPNWVSVHPLVLVMLASLSADLKPGSITIDNFEAKSKNYFERMGLFKFLGIQSGISIVKHESAGRFVPITQIKDSITLSQFVTDIIPLLHLDPLQTESIRYIVSELVRNVLEHSRSPHGAFVAAQYYPKSNSIKIGVADTGVGIKESISHSHLVKTNLEAIPTFLLSQAGKTLPSNKSMINGISSSLVFLIN